MEAEAIEAARPATDLPAPEPDLESIFRESYTRVVGIIARGVRDRGRAEDLAVEVFLKLCRLPPGSQGNLCWWLYRTWFVEFQQQYRDRGLAIVGLSLDESWGPVKPFIEEKKINYRVALATDEVTNRYHVESMPTTLMIDRSGRIAWTHVGLGKKEEFRDEIEALLKK